MLHADDFFNGLRQTPMNYLYIYNNITAVILHPYWRDSHGCCLSQDAPVQTQVRQALARPRVAHALRPNAASSQRITSDLRSMKWSNRRDERYRIVSSHRTGLSVTAEQQSLPTDASESTGNSGKDESKSWGQIQVVDLLHEDSELDKLSGKVSLTSLIQHWPIFYTRSFIFLCFNSSNLNSNR